MSTTGKANSAEEGRKRDGAKNLRKSDAIPAVSGPDVSEMEGLREKTGQFEADFSVSSSLTTSKWTSAFSSW